MSAAGASHGAPRLGATLLFVCLGLGCSPGIQAFRAAPNVICGGGQATLTWIASDDGTLSSIPPDATLGPVSATGTRAVTPSAPTTYRLTVTRWGKAAFREIGVEVVSAPVEAKAIGASVADPSTTCDGHTLAITVDAPASAWDARIQVAAVGLAAGVNRTYHVEHAGRSADISPGAPSALFAGLAVQGSWRLSTPLAPTEACGRNVPRSLIIEVASTCQK
jgi:hypothetical protein